MDALDTFNECAQRAQDDLAAYKEGRRSNLPLLNFEELASMFKILSINDADTPRIVRFTPVTTLGVSGGSGTLEQDVQKAVQHRGFDTREYPLTSQLLHGESRLFPTHRGLSSHEHNALSGETSSLNC